MRTALTVRLPLIAPALALALALSAAPAGAATRSFTFTFGPIAAGPYQGVKGGDPVTTPPMTGSIVAMDANVVDASGAVIPQSQVMLHHLVFFNQGRPGAVRRDPNCGRSRRTYERFYGTSEELRPLTLPEGYGYPVDRRESWRASWMVMNHTRDDRRAWIRYRVTVDDTAGLTPVQPYWVGVMPCGPDPQWTVRGGRPAGYTSTRSGTWKVPVTGRIVAVGGHLHGGAKRLRLSQPRCGDRTLVTSRPLYGPAEDPVYQVKPLLHEPDPLNISWWQSAAGIPVVAGEKLVVSADYDGGRPHMRVMGIDHVYLAADAAAGRACEPLPADAQELGADFQGRPEPPPVDLTIARMGDDGFAHAVLKLPGRLVRFGGTATVREAAYSFRPANLSIPVGGRVRWRFSDRDQHDVTVAYGPRGFGSPWSRRGDRYSRRFTVPGTYRLHCSLHPVYMSQVVRVRAPASRAAASSITSSRLQNAKRTSARPASGSS